MAKYSYNGVILPVLPNVGTAYPKLCIVESVSTGYYALYCFSNDASFLYNGTDGGGNTVYIQAVATNMLMSGVFAGASEWPEPFANDLANLHSASLETIWTNFDIIAEDGSVFLAASEPVLVEEPKFDLRSFLTGLALGLSGKPLPLANKEPIAYLYNGVQLPPLPEWDKAKYPYAYIGLQRTTSSIGSDRYWLYASETPFFAYGGGAATAPETTISAITAFNTNTLGYWKGEQVEVFSETSACYAPIWTSYDFYWKTSDGVVLLLAASDPIPVYE